MGRRGTYFALDCQSANEVKSFTQGAEDFLLMFKTTSWRDKAEMCDELKKERRMRQDQVADLGFLNKGECYIAETGRVVKKCKITLPRTMFWEKRHGNFYKNVWERYGAGWENIGDTRDYLLKRIEDMKEIRDNMKDKVIKEVGEKAKAGVKAMPIIEIEKIPQKIIPREEDLELPVDLR